MSQNQREAVEDELCTLQTYLERVRLLVEHSVEEREESETEYEILDAEEATAEEGH